MSKGGSLLSLLALRKNAEDKHFALTIRLPLFTVYVYLELPKRTTTNKIIPAIAEIQSLLSKKGPLLLNAMPPGLILPKRLAQEQNVMSWKYMKKTPKHSIRSSAPRSANRSKSLPSNCESVEPIDAPHLDVLGIPGKVKPDDDNQVGKHKDAALEIVALEIKRSVLILANV